MKRLTPLTDVRYIDEQIATRISAAKIELNSNVDSLGAGEQSPKFIEEEDYVKDDGSNVGVPEPAFNREQAATLIDIAVD